MNEVVYYMGIGAFGYAVMYDTEQETEVLASVIYRTFGQAHSELTRLQEKQQREHKEYAQAIGEIFIEGA